MIDINYILQGNCNTYNPSPYYLLESALIDFGNEIDYYYNEYCTNVSPLYLESEITGVLTVEKQENIGKEKTNILAKIGQAVKSIIKKIHDFCDSCMNKVKDLVFSFKSSEKKMNKLIKEHPELSKEKIQFLCDEGGLDFNDFKSFSQMDKAFDELLEAAKDPKVDEKSMKGKFNKFKKKVDNDKSSLQTAAKVAGAATTVIGLYTTVKLIKKAQKDSAEASAKMRKQCDIDKQSINTLMQEIYTKKDKENDFNSMGKMTYVLNAYRIKSGHQSKVLNNHVSIVSKMANMFTKAVDKITNTGASKAILGDVNTNYRKDIVNSVERLNRDLPYYDNDKPMNKKSGGK